MEIPGECKEGKILMETKRRSRLFAITILKVKFRQRLLRRISVIGSNFEQGIGLFPIWTLFY